MAHPMVLAFVLAGGKGERLFPLTAFRSKPSVPFGGRYRIVDFVLSNLVNSHIYSIYLLVQYKSQSLIEHVRKNWVLSSIIKDHFVAVVPPQMRMGPEWFQGTADAIFQNVNLIRRHNPKLVIIFGADHIYRMDIRQMIDFHLENEAFVTVAARPVPIEQAALFGVIITDSEKRIVGFQEKPKKPTSMPDDPGRAYVSMGNYIFNRDVLLQVLAKAQRRKQHDFGAHVIPDLVETGKVFAYDFATNIIPGTMPYEEEGYWRDVGTISAFFEAHMDMLGDLPLFELDNKLWPIHPSGFEGPATKILRGDIRNSIIAEGTVIHKAKIRNSIIRSGVTIENDVSVEDCIIMDEVVIKKGCRLNRVIVDKLNVIDECEQIGFAPEKDRFRCHIDSSGIAIIPRGGKLVRTSR
ncbi:MAG: glucose-1-phosphate adenylyltransferase [Nitrospirae bacterium CG_4_10_14_0_8_um_filter_41_23]|nr:glucose-1-phosphate adenylyltransferase [Nitrospirota bacterium]OIP61644.1 MAG: glucose-1-phosphate adenylyltransferase [Nitrospirae bacterium CG2_30_41_42]PIQ94068.1 MAG: glucose-1-phosphate adenylyltransferase [Nitrospirae bacterium CG11_big_fil_rev_8_21_14_0_20_41_14]PIV44502.1 MAG: glucose-1-phosphate adenylyltransferase [Nitrospirae bacterium CG02_land_8_20_14_3_00_41_53]PIW87101.1 MAG: glucose-1-phosphate adenylyltransferase [Nitrospirae bacterium CG_4_8_14_3_um_filter_41_47]PIY85903.